MADLSLRETSLGKEVFKLSNVSIQNSDYPFRVALDWNPMSDRSPTNMNRSNPLLTPAGQYLRIAKTLWSSHAHTISGIVEGTFNSATIEYRYIY